MIVGGINTIMEPLLMAWIITFLSYGLISTLQYFMFRYREYMNFRFPDNIPADVKKSLIQQEISKHLAFYEDIPKEKEETPLNS